MPPLLLTKLHPPAGRAQTIARDRLAERLRPQPGVKLTVLAAPAGSGKTTLLGSWRDNETPGRPVAWVTIDTGDDDARVLWAHVLESLRRVCPGTRLPALPAPGRPPEIAGALLPQLVNDLSEHPGAALILDDFHQLSSGDARDGVAWLVEHAPPSLQLVLATRSEPALPLGALRAHGELVELRADELAFTTDEADTFLNERLGLGLASDDVERLVQRTEGWPAGLYLAALSLRGAPDRRALVRSFGGTSRHLVDFLIGEVLDAHDPEMQSLMLRTSVLERLCGPLCDAVLQQRGSDARLRALARTNLFLVPLDDVGTWYRFHRLFAQLLRVELEHREPGLSVELQARATAWHRANASPTLAGEARTRGSQGRLSQRELTVLRMLRGRLSERDIGRELYLSHNTIHTHTRSIYRKLGVRSRPEAVQHASELGLI